MTVISTSSEPLDSANLSANPFASPHMASLRALFMVALHNGIELSNDVFSSYTGGDIPDFILQVARDVELRGKMLTNRKWSDLLRLESSCPFLAEMQGGAWAAITGTHPFPDGQLGIAVMDAQIDAQGITLLERAHFLSKWTGRIILCKRDIKVTDEKRPFGFSWFLPEIYRNRRYLRDVAIAAIMSNVLSFMTPLFFNVMIDKVIPHHAYNSLIAITLIYIVCVLCDGAFTFLRNSLMLVAGNKIDARLAERTFQHLLRLPLNFFETTQAGVLVRNMQQSEGVRQFLTGSLFQTMLDLIGLPILLIGLSTFSGVLTLVVFGFAFAIAALIGMLLPTFRKRLEQLYHAESLRQADLVETVHGIRAVKSLGLEKLRKAAWDTKVAQAIRRRFAVGQYGIICSVIVTALQNLMQLSILAVGSLLVFEGHLTLGALIAFNMLSGRVTGPLVQMVHLINEYQQTALSVKMLRSVMDRAPERPDGQTGLMPIITGQMEISDVTFSYGRNAAPALDHLNFTIEEGEMIGIVGRSGSGKTTLTRLIQGIETAQHGMIKLNGVDIRHVDLAHLRRSIGVVLQDNILFRGTIRDNIAAARPEASFEQVQRAARLAGADEFIERLPMSYDTPVEESATNFSGGQKQRIAIARALLPSPRLLIFDEATSALDPESEAIVQQNLESISRNRTTVIVSHRLSSLVDCDKILVLERGVAIDYAPHSVLVERCDIYRQLWQTQTRHVG